MFDGEALALMGLGFRLCFYAEIYCPTDGVLRIALEYEPGDRHPCPRCGLDCAAGLLFCRGFTRRALPFHERILGPLTVSHRLPAADEPRPSKPPVPLAENEQHALDALRAGATAVSVSLSHHVSLNRLYRLKRRYGLPIRPVHQAVTRMARVACSSGMKVLGKYEECL